MPMRRALWLLVAAVVLGGIAASVVLLRGGTTHTEHSTLADAQAALVPLSEMPTGTAQAPVSLSEISCNAKAFVKPLVRALANYHPPDAVPVGESVAVYKKGTAAEIMSDVRAQWNCAQADDRNRPDLKWAVSVLSFPQLARDQASYQISTTSSFTDYTLDIIELRVNASAVVVVTSESTFGVPDIQETEAFVQKAWHRARNTLGG